MTLRKPIPKTARKLSPEKAYILGVICDDGYINYEGYISLETISIEFIEKFKESIINVYGNLFLGHVSPTCNRKQRFVVSGKNMTDDLKRYLGENTRSFDWRVPKQIMNSNNENKIHFIRGFFDSEGNVDLKHALVFNSANYDALVQVKQLVEKLNIKTSTIRPNKGAYRIYVTSKENIVRFIKLIGTNIENKYNKMKILLNGYGTRLSSDGPTV